MTSAAPVPGFAHRLAYLRWLQNRGRVKPLTDAEVAAWLGVGLKWLGKWKTKREAPEGRTEARAVERALATIDVTIDWLYDGEGAPPEPSQWAEWLRRVPIEVVPATRPRRGAQEHLAKTAVKKRGRNGGSKAG